MGFDYNELIVTEENKSAITLAIISKHHNRTKYNAIKYMLFNRVHKGDTRVLNFSTNMMLPDIAKILVASQCSRQMWLDLEIQASIIM